MITTCCRFCRGSISIPIPADPRMAQVIQMLSTKACCNRCADYRRRLRDIADTVQHIAFDLTRAEESAQSDIIGRIRRLLGVAVRIVEDHYLLSGYEQHLGDFVKNIVDVPTAARWQIQIFEQAVGLDARKLHNGAHGHQTQPDHQETFA
jgi:hypothetical protein